VTSSGSSPESARGDALGGLEVWVVDGQATSRRVLETWLRSWKMRPTLVSDAGAPGELLAPIAAEGRYPAVVIVDGTTSGAGALELSMSSQEADAVALPRVVVLTSGHRAGALARWTAGRADACLAKPVLDDELHETLLSVLQGKQRNTTPRLEQGSDSGAGPAVVGRSGLRIVVAEDNEFNSQLMSQLLAKRGHLVRIARTGAEALRQVELDGCDLLLLDVHMPELDGFQVIKTIREREQSTGRRLPVLAVTARSRAEDRDRCLNAGMDDYLAKPINAASLWAAVDRLAVRASAGTAERGTTSEDSSSMGHQNLRPWGQILSAA